MLFIEKNFSLIIKDTKKLLELGLASVSQVSANILYIWKEPDEHECDFGASVSVRSIKVILENGSDMGGNLDDEIYDHIKEFVFEVDYRDIDKLSDFGDEIVL
jgi:hypothetical protein